jgi:hypothetical protein
VLKDAARGECDLHSYFGQKVQTFRCLEFGWLSIYTLGKASINGISMMNLMGI